MSSFFHYHREQLGVCCRHNKPEDFTKQTEREVGPAPWDRTHPKKQAPGFKLIMTPSSQIIDQAGVLALRENELASLEMLAAWAGPLGRLKNQNTVRKKPYDWAQQKSSIDDIISEISTPRSRGPHSRVNSPFMAHCHPPLQTLVS